MFFYRFALPLTRKCPGGGIGRRVGLKHQWETVPVRSRPWVLTGFRPEKSKDCSQKSSPFFVDPQ